VHEAYAKGALVILPALDEYEKAKKYVSAKNSKAQSGVRLHAGVMFTLGPPNRPLALETNEYDIASAAMPADSNNMTATTRISI
jgi:hypothetical protein